MKQPQPPLSGAGSPAGAGRGRLSISVVLDHAMELARTEGLPGVSMRRLGVSVGVRPMSLYHYVPSRAALMVLMADRSATRALTEADRDGSWDEQLLELLMALYRAGVDNAALFEVLAAQPLRAEKLPSAQPDAGGPLTELLDRILALLDQAHLRQEHVGSVFRGLIGVVVGFLVAQVDGLSTPPGQPVNRPAQNEHSRLATLQPTLHATDPAEGLRYSLQTFLRGVADPPG